jgi:hypothetical protein
MSSPATAEKTSPAAKCCTALRARGVPSSPRVGPAIAATAPTAGATSGNGNGK